MTVLTTNKTSDTSYIASFSVGSNFYPDFQSGDYSGGAVYAVEYLEYQN
jgi:hypothetical protein